MIIIDIFLVVSAYLLGSISSAIIVCKFMHLPDPRIKGSKNPGATNVMRIGGRKAAAITLLGDWTKGILPMLVANFFNVTPLILGLTGLAAFIGHLYPIFFGFKGGKGVATTLGTQFGLLPQIGLTVTLIWLFTIYVLKISSFAALVSIGLAPIIVWIFWPEPILVFVQIVITIILFWRHHSNIIRLYIGNETKIKKNAKNHDQE